MNREIMRAVAGANLVAGCVLLQGCGLLGQKSDHAATQVPGGDLPPVDVTPVETLSTVEQLPVVLPVAINNTTPYTIQKGETISSVSYKYGLRWQDVVAVNPGISPTRLRVGQVIQLPGNVDLGNVRRVPAVTTKPATAPSTSAPATVKSAAAVSGATTTYVVKSGDSLSVIAQKHGIKTAELRTLNNLKGDKIVVGQKLKVPAATDKKAATTAAPIKSQTAAVVPPKTTAPQTSVGTTKAVSTEPKSKETAPVAPPPPPATTVVETAPVKAEPAPPPAPAPAAPVDPNAQMYTVKDGEDLYAVAIRWGVSPSDLKALNNLTGSELKAGTQLKIPSGN